MTQCCSCGLVGSIITPDNPNGTLLVVAPLILCLKCADQ